MVCLVVAAHGHLAEGLVASSAMIVGPSDDVVAVTFAPSEGPDDLLAKYAAAVEASSSQEHLILVDLFGGSPYNAAARFAAGRDDADVVTGVNLPMVIEVLSRRLAGAGLAELVEAPGRPPPTASRSSPRSSPLHPPPLPMMKETSSDGRQAPAY